MQCNGGEAVNLHVVNSPEELPLPVIRVCGTSEERGIQYGEQARERIRKALTIYKRIVSDMRPDGIAYEDMLQEAQRFIPILRRYDKELFLEIQGIAKGSRCSLEEIMFLNARSEIMNPVWMNTNIHEGCSSFVVEPALTEKKVMFAGQTYDWYPECQQLLVLYLSRNEDGLEVATITEAGIIAKIGCNNYGVANLLNYLNSFEINEKGVLYHVLLRRVLDSKNFYEAQRQMLRSPIAFGLNLFVADTQNHAVNYELTANGSDFFLPAEGRLIHTNHYLSDYLSLRRFIKQDVQESELRYRTIVDYLKEKSGNITVEDLLQMTSLHEETGEHAGIICRHGRTDLYGMETIFSLIMNMTEHMLYLCVGTPCNHAFYGIAMRNLFQELRFQ